MFLDKKLLENLLAGAALLGSGGGGSIAAGKTFITSILLRTDGIELLMHPLSEADSARKACVVCDIGAVSAFDINQVAALNNAFDGLCKAFESKVGQITALFPIETGPENVLAPFVLASFHTGMAVIDGDGAGRAIPILPLSTFSLEKPSNWHPVALANGKGDVMMITSDKIENFDKLLRAVAHLDDLSDSASLALWPDTAEALSEKSVKGSISTALYCGMLLEGIKTADQSLIDTALPNVNRLNGYLISMGRLMFKKTVTTGGFDFTTTKFMADGEIITVISQNENLMVFSDLKDSPIAVAPDSICYLRSDLEPLTNAEIIETSGLTEDFFFIVGVHANQKLRAPEALAGFDDIIQGLRYNTKLDISRPVDKSLGELILEISRLEICRL